MSDCEEQSTAKDYRVRIAIKCADGIPLIVVEGECDAFTAPFTHGAINALIDEGHQAIIVDINKLEFLDVAGFHSLDDCCRNMAEHGGKLLLVNPSKEIEEIYEILRERESCELIKSVSDARAILNQRPDKDGL